MIVDKSIWNRLSGRIFPGLIKIIRAPFFVEHPVWSSDSELTSNDGKVKSGRGCECVYDRMDVNMQLSIYPDWKVGVESDSFPTFRPR